MGTVFSGFGTWNAGAWVLFFLIASAGVLAFRRTGRVGFRPGEHRDEIFYGGNPAEDPNALQVPASAAYWGFGRALDGYYRFFVALHDGDATRAPLAFVAVTALLAALLIVLEG